MKYYSEIKRNGVLTHSTTLDDLENITLSERSQTQKAYIVRFHLYDISRIEEAL